ncbi:MAG: HRDC domain-containing protein, partial [Gammaproteobacteria bacterium]|nr:HRDC domain-containing protein [Gammaproteobacteria bacterium]
KRKTTTLAVADQSLFDALRDCRKRIATESGVPPYVIFHDATLMQMATEKPASDSALLGIAGVGQTKLQRYGAKFLRVIEQVSGSAEP